MGNKILAYVVKNEKYQYGATDKLSKVSNLFSTGHNSYIDPDDLWASLKQAKLAKEILEDQLQINHKIYRIEITELEGDF